ncbi:hypothetical protein [Tabrizicola sp. TH137]|uniref:DUF3885 domain-containing protein n=1 Tax=Tabrizicola sp. TH137 TaxID=2067452 RepID=UPI00117F0027|nr:hypothetical protein [Tabrizicola sp. TH137]
MDDAELTEAIARAGLGNAPIGHLIRLHAPDRWVRFHFFESKRDPETPAEDSAVFSKFATLGDRLFADGQPVKVCVWSVWTDDEGRDCYRCLSRNALWSPLPWRERLLDMAHFGMNSFTLLSMDARSALSCYDGGFDVFLRDRAERDLFRAQFSEWLSPREDGL